MKEDTIIAYVSTIFIFKKFDLDSDSCITSNAGNDKLLCLQN